MHVDGIAASAASLVAIAGQKTHISPDATFMIHRAWTGTIGDRDEMQHTLEILEQVDRQMASMYHRKTGIAVEELLERMSAEWWMDAATARKHGFVDAIASPPQRNAGGTAAMYDRPWFARSPRGQGPAVTDRPRPGAGSSAPSSPASGPGAQPPAVAAAASTQSWEIPDAAS